ncbi:MAG: thermonuclease family protein [Candidatus Pacebacteria bacterium]|nr:thermonuclease family protein [Candidatus Paceibacterota bacterium]
MLRKFKKITIIFVLCVLVSSVVVVMMIGNKYKNTLQSNTRKKFTSWALTVPIDSEKLYPVAEVVDGDTLKIHIAGHDITTRLLGVNTPEVVDPRKPVECYGKEASEASKRLLTGKNVFVAINPNYERTDKFGRLLAYVWLALNPHNSDARALSSGTTSSLFVNNYLIKEGFGREYTFNVKNPYQYQKLFKEEESVAKKLGKGLWGSCKDN